ncbi:MAG: coproporphyrinogen III oxidase, partial [Rhodospirillaceae bacterium]|nr:coproporphyrinogen III oxidase [Rhodospirillaceae bacterium]
EEEREALSATERAEECLMLGLRLAEGVPEARLRAASGLGFDAALDPDALARLRNGGFVTFEDGVLAATPAGRQRLDAVLAALLAGSRP